MWPAGPREGVAEVERGTYNVHVMKRYTVSQFRQSLARALDEVERGEPVVVERGGRRYRVVPERVRPAGSRAKPFFKLLDRSILDPGWTWDWEGPGRPLRIRSARKPRPVR